MFNIGLRKVGGIWFWNVGRIGGSFHVQSRMAFAAKRHKIASEALVKSATAVEKQWWPYGWTEAGFQRHMDYVANFDVIEATHDM